MTPLERAQYMARTTDGTIVIRDGVVGRIVARYGDTDQVAVAWGEHANLNPHYAIQYAVDEEMSKLTVVR